MICGIYFVNLRKTKNMKKKLLLPMVLGLTLFGARAQNADSDRRLHNATPSDAQQKTIVVQPVNKPFQRNASAGCMPASMCPQLSVYSGSVRGYYFVAPRSFVICGLLIPTDASTGPQSIEVLRFGTAPPAYPSLTNNFTSLFYVASDTGLTTPVSCNIHINSGDTIGVYGARSTSTTCSYGSSQCKISILGDSTVLIRSGMQYSLYDQQMHDVWSEASSNISRVIMYVDSAATYVQQTTLDASVNVYPNPSSGIFSIEFKNNTTIKGDIEVYNVVGEKVYQSALGTSNKVDLSIQPKGFYLLYLRTNQGILVKKITIEK
jgi:hypothetical protein